MDILKMSKNEKLEKVLKKVAFLGVLDHNGLICRNNEFQTVMLIFHLFLQKAFRNNFL
jgi:hypothetical protein